MKRTSLPLHKRQFITLLGGAVATWPLAARAQQRSRIPKVGVLHPGQAANANTRIVAIREGLNDPDNQPESRIEMVVRLADGDLARLPALATDLVNNRVDAILAAGPPAVQAARGATATVPVIAIDLESDPVASGLVASLARPGGNVTGIFWIFRISVQNACSCSSSPFRRSLALESYGIRPRAHCSSMPSRPRHKDLASAYGLPRHVASPTLLKRSTRSTFRTSKEY
jgi:hypothetical protein